MPGVDMERGDRCRSPASGGGCEPRGEEAGRFIGEPIEVAFDTPPAVSKKPGRPDRFTWRGEVHEIVAELRVWVDYSRRGRMRLNMRPDHAAAATLRGSLGVGRFYFRVRTATGRVFDVYYDRAPRSVDDRAGSWHLLRELTASS